MKITPLFVTFSSARSPVRPIRRSKSAMGAHLDSIASTEEQGEDELHNDPRRSQSHSFQDGAYVHV